MTLAQTTLRVAALGAVAAYFADQYQQARKEAETAYKDNAVRKLVIVLPDGEELGEVTVQQPGPHVAVDEEALLAWVAEHTPTEVEEHLDEAILTDQEAIEWARQNRDDLLRRRVRRVWRDELQKVLTANDGDVIDEKTGATTKVAEVTKNRATGAFAFSPDPRKARAQRIMSALLAGELAGVIELPVTLALPEAGE